MEIQLTHRGMTYYFTERMLPEGSAWTTNVDIIDKDSGYGSTVDVLIVPDPMNYDCPSREFHDLYASSALRFRSFHQFLRTLKDGGIDYIIRRPNVGAKSVGNP